MRPVLKPALRRVWRDASTLQLGVDPARAVVLRGLDPGLAGALALLDGTRSREEVVSEAALDGVARPGTEALLDLLGAAGALDDGGSDPLRGVGQETRGRLAPDLASLSLVHARPGDADRALTRRRATRVRLDGAGRVGAALALLLAEAGVGTVTVDDPGLVRPADLSPGGLTRRDLGRSRGDAVRRRLRDRPLAGLTPPAGPPDLVILAPAVPVATPASSALVRTGTPHLLVGVQETTAVVGPLVLPGSTCCLDCLDLHRGERDPGWPVVAAQLDGRGRGRAVDACDGALAGLAAALAALQVLAWLDAEPGTAPPPAVGGTLELALPDWRVRRRSFSVHPACPCTRG